MLLRGQPEGPRTPQPEPLGAWGKCGAGSAECGRWTPDLEYPGGVTEISRGLRVRQHPTPPGGECGTRSGECGRWTPVLEYPGGVTEISRGLRGRQHPTPPGGECGTRSGECGRWTPVLEYPGGVTEISRGLRGRQHPTPPGGECGMGSGSGVSPLVSSTVFSSCYPFPPFSSNPGRIGQAVEGGEKQVHAARWSSGFSAVSFGP
jgi:hypothetical protein